MDFVAIGDASREMSGGMRMGGNQPLSQDEIEFIRKEIRRIGADESVYSSSIIQNIRRPATVLRKTKCSWERRMRPRA